MRKPVVLLALALAVAVGPAPAAPLRAADEPLDAGACTRRGRSLRRALDEVLAPGKLEADEARTILFVVDPSPSLQSAGFAGAFREALEGAKRKLEGARVGVQLARAKEKAVFGEPGDPDAVLAVVDEAFRTPRVVFADVYEAARQGAKALSGKRGARELVLVTLENGDVESDAEAAAKTLRRAKVKVSVLTGQAFLSDTYWTYRGQELPRGMEARAGEAAFVQLPWGYVFQQVAANEATGSGFASFGLTRLAAASGGVVHLFDDGRTTDHACTVRGTTCAFCDADHLPGDTVYRDAPLTAMAPRVDARDAVLSAAAADPYFSAVLKAWEGAYDERLVSAAPSVKRAGASLKPQSRASSRLASLGRTLGFDREAREAVEMADACTRIADALRAEIDAIPSDAGSPRMRAHAETTYGLLRLTRVNLLGFAAFCREVAPKELDGSLERAGYPETSYSREGWRATGVTFSGFSLCHGVRPFLRQRWPGGEAQRREIEALADVWDRLLATYAHTPYGMALRRSAIARFQLAGVGKPTGPAPRERPNQEDEDSTTGKGRTPRGGAEGGGSGGASTGGD